MNCNDCKYCVETNQLYTDVPRHECHKHPPSFVSISHTGCWPTVKPEDWCGEFSKRVNVKDYRQVEIKVPEDQMEEARKALNKDFVDATLRDWKENPMTLDRLNDFLEERSLNTVTPEEWDRLQPTDLTTTRSLDKRTFEKSVYSSDARVFTAPYDCIITKIDIRITEDTDLVLAPGSLPEIFMSVIENYENTAALLINKGEHVTFKSTKPVNITLWGEEV